MTEQAVAAIYEIIQDIESRKGVGDEFAQIDDDIKLEIVEKWASIIKKHCE